MVENPEAKVENFKLNWEKLGLDHASQYFSDFGSLYDSDGTYIPTTSFTSTSTTTTTTTTTTITMTTTTTTFRTTTSQPKFETLESHGEIINCKIKPILCYELKEQKAVKEQIQTTTLASWEETSKFWVSTRENDIVIDWVRLISKTYFYFFYLIFLNPENTYYLLKDSETGTISISAYGILGIVLAGVALLASIIFGVWWSKFRMAVYRPITPTDNQELLNIAVGNNPDNHPDNNPDNNFANNDDNPVPERKI